MSKAQARILILGAGATGLGAAYRLQELGHSNFLVLEKNHYPGGLAASFTDAQGFVWDVGGHVQFSHYEYFDRLMNRALGDAWVHHRRDSYVWICGRFIPYPLQNNLRHLPRKVMTDCVLELVRLGRNARPRPAHFADWLRVSFGEGIARHFLLPYNFKVWAHPLEMMGYSWIGERVATVNLEKVLENIFLEKDERRWGPNDRFRFPLHGGTGAVWSAVAGLLPSGSICYGEEVESIHPGARLVRTSAGSHRYDYLISSVPLDRLTGLLGEADLVASTRQLRRNSIHILGIGFKGRPPDSIAPKTWMYFPEGNCPFYRVTVFSNYSPHNVPDISQHWSLMAEISESEFKPVERTRLLDQTLDGIYATQLADRSSEVISTWSRTAEHGYPIPTTDRDEVLRFVNERLESMDIFSRGRFGAWKYEVSNQDHSCMQGVEAVDRILFGVPEMTYPIPDAVNNRGGQVPLR